MQHEQTRRLAAILSTHVTVIRERCPIYPSFRASGNSGIQSLALSPRFRRGDRLRAGAQFYYNLAGVHQSG